MIDDFEQENTFTPALKDPNWNISIPKLYSVPVIRTSNDVRNILDQIKIIKDLTNLTMIQMIIRCNAIIESGIWQDVVPENITSQTKLIKYLAEKCNLHASTFKRYQAALKTFGLNPCLTYLKPLATLCQSLKEQELDFISEKPEIRETVILFIQNKAKRFEIVDYIKTQINSEPYFGLNPSLKPVSIHDASYKITMKKDEMRVKLTRHELDIKDQEDLQKIISQFLESRIKEKESR